VLGAAFRKKQDMKIKKKTLNIIEGIGLILILGSFFIQLLENDSANFKQEMRYYRLNSKMDYLWTIVSKDYSEKHPQDDITFSIDFKSYLDNWKIYSEEKKEVEKFKKKLNFMPVLEI
jgi:hypothetical protein